MTMVFLDARRRFHVRSIENIFVQSVVSRGGHHVFASLATPVRLQLLGAKDR